MASSVVTLVRHAWARHRTPLVAMSIAVMAFEFLITRIAPAPGEVSWISSILDAVPPDIVALFGNDIARSPGGFLAIGYGHPFFLLLLGTWVVRTSSAALAGEIGLGTMDLIASRPVRRWQIVTAGALAMSGGAAIVILSAWMGTALGLHLRRLGVAPDDMLPVAIGAWLLFTAWGALGLATSAARREGGPAIGLTTAFIAGSFVLDYVARLWTPMNWARPFSLFRYYEPQAIFASGLSARTLTVLGGVVLVSLVMAIVTFGRRDL